MHEGVGHSFANTFHKKLVLLCVDASLAPTGSGRFGRRGGRSKETVCVQC
jgi:hypothetical protein